MLATTIVSQTKELQVIDISIISDVEEEKLVQATSSSMFSTQETFQPTFFPLLMHIVHHTKVLHTDDNVLT
jgi:hypothetical protein